MWHPAREDDALPQVQLPAERLQLFVVLTATYDDEPARGPQLEQLGHPAKQDIQALEREELADEPDNRRAVETERAGECRVPRDTDEPVRVHTVRNDPDSRWIDAAGRDLVFQSLADRDHRVTLSQGAALEMADDPVPEAPFPDLPLVFRGVLPQRADLVNERDAEAPGDPGCRNAAQDRGMRVDDVDVTLTSDPVDRALEATHEAALPQERRPIEEAAGEPGREPGAVVVQVADAIHASAVRGLPGGCHCQRLEQRLPLELHDALASRRVAADTWDRTIQHVENPHDLRSLSSCCRFAGRGARDERMSAASRSRGCQPGWPG